MSNEELVAAIQSGENRKGELWEQIEGLVKWKAKRVLTALELRGTSCGCEFDDLVQCGYPAMVAAVESYTPGSGSFSTWLMYYLQKEFAEVTGYRTKRGRSEPLNESVSLDKPLGDEADGTVFSDLIPDRRAAATIERIEEREYQRQLKYAIDRALSELPPDVAEVLRLRNFAQLTLEEIGERWQLSQEKVRQMENKGLRKLRDPKIARTLRPFIDFDFYSGTGLSAYRNTGMSVEERVVLVKEQRMERAWRHQKADEKRTQKALAEAGRILARYHCEQKAEREIPALTGEEAVRNPSEQRANSENATRMQRE